MSITIGNRGFSLHKHRNRKLQRLEASLRFDPALGLKMPEDVLYLIIETAGAGAWRDPDGTSSDWRKTAAGEWRKPGDSDWEKGGGLRTPKFIFKFHKKDERIDLLSKHIFRMVSRHNVHPDPSGVELGYPDIFPPRRYLIDVNQRIPCYICSYKMLDCPYCTCASGRCFRLRPRF
jgi:hypothetical protein